MKDKFFFLIFLMFWSILVLMFFLKKDISFLEFMVWVSVWEMVLYIFFFSFYSYHMMLLLMMMEMMVIKLFFLMSLNILFGKLEFFTIFIYMVVVAAEAGIGVSILTSLIRTHGSDFLAVSSV